MTHDICKRSDATSCVVAVLTLFLLIGCANAPRANGSSEPGTQPLSTCKKHKPDLFPPTLDARITAEIERVCNVPLVATTTCARCDIYNGFARQTLPDINITKLSLGELLSYYRYWLLRLSNISVHAYQDTHEMDVVRIGLEISRATNTSQVVFWQKTAKLLLNEPEHYLTKKYWEPTLAHLWQLEQTIMNPSDDMAANTRRVEELSVVFEGSLQLSLHAQEISDALRW